MKESVIFQEIDAAAFQRGVQNGVQREQSLILRQLQRRVVTLTSASQSQIDALPLD